MWSKHVEGQEKKLVSTGAERRVSEIPELGS